MAEATRRSTRKRVANKKYVHDVVEDIQELLGSGSGESLPAVSDDDGSAVDEDFNQDLAQHESVDDDGLSSDECEKEPNGAEQLDRADLASADDLLEEDEDVIPTTPGSEAKRRRGQSAPQKSQHLHSRGLPSHKTSVSKGTAITELGGTDPKDVNPLIVERAKWIFHETLPPRAQTVKATGGLDHPSMFTEDMRHAEAESFRNWYLDDGGQEKMSKAQHIITLDSETAKEYMPASLLQHRVLLGPYGNQKQFMLNPGDTLSISEAWKEAEAQLDVVEESTKQHSRDGWLINLGDRITCLDWAPNHENDKQYIAIATTSNPPLDHPHCTAFEPVEHYKASITIWELISKKENNVRFMDMSVEPRMVQVLCTEWGAIRRLEWCPAAKPLSESTENGFKSIGLLAGIWSDGYLRVLDVKIDVTGNTQGTFVKYKGAAFASKPPDTVCTCMSWLSATSIVAGCADGSVAAWNIAKHITSGRNSLTSLPSDDPNSTESPIPTPPAPFFYHPLHITYVLNISAHYPFPTLYITTCAADGYHRLTSLRHPHTDTTNSPRCRNSISPLAYSPHILSVITPDDNDAVRTIPLRQFFAPRTVAKASAQVTCLDAGKAHPSLLVGNSDGTVMVTNPMRRIYIRKDAPGKAAAWQQVWFRHEWVADQAYASKPAPEAPSAGQGEGEDQGQSLQHLSTQKYPTETSDPSTAPDSATSVPFPITPKSSTSNPSLRPGLSRHLEAFKLQSVPLVRTVANSIRPFMNRPEFKQHYSQAAAAAESDGAIYDTIYEEEAAVTCVSWNPNPAVGAWAAAGLGSGVVRVGDLGI